MLTEVFASELESALQVFENSALRTFSMLLACNVERNFFVEEVHLAGFLEVGSDSEDDPEVVIAVPVSVCRIAVSVENASLFAGVTGVSFVTRVFERTGAERYLPDAARR